MRRVAQLILVLTSGLLIFLLPMAAEERSGHTDWGPWSFDWEVRNNAGLSIRNVDFQGERVLYKGSLPVIRVKYAEDACHCSPTDPFSSDCQREVERLCGCGPYADQIFWIFADPNDPHAHGLVPVPDCDNRRVCQRSFEYFDPVTHKRFEWLEISVYMRVGGYHIYQAWFLSSDGQLQPTIFSKGLTCTVQVDINPWVKNHTHHPYWRFDFDVNGPCDDQIFVWDGGRPNEGWGAGWHEYPHELNDVKNESTGRVWFVRDNPTGHGVWVFPGIRPGPGDGTADSWSRLDIGARLYDYKQDEPWPFDVGELGYNNSKDMRETDVVLWYVSHMYHNVLQGNQNIFHISGPDIIIERAGGGPQRTTTHP